MNNPETKKRGSIWHLIGLLAVLAILGYFAPPVAIIYVAVVLVGVLVHSAPQRRVSKWN